MQSHNNRDFQMRIIIESIDRSDVRTHASGQTQTLAGQIESSDFHQQDDAGFGAASFSDAASDVQETAMLTGSFGDDPRGFGAASTGDTHAADFTAAPSSHEGFGAVSFDE